MRLISEWISLRKWRVDSILWQLYSIWYGARWSCQVLLILNIFEHKTKTNVQAMTIDKCVWWENTENKLLDIYFSFCYNQQLITVCTVSVHLQVSVLKCCKALWKWKAVPHNQPSNLTPQIIGSERKIKSAMKADRHSYRQPESGGRYYTFVCLWGRQWNKDVWKTWQSVSIC